MIDNLIETFKICFPYFSSNWKFIIKVDLKKEVY